MCRARSILIFAGLLEQAKNLYKEHNLVLPPPPWEIDGKPATWRTAWQVVDIELGASGSRGREYWELFRYTQGLVLGLKALTGQEVE